MEGADMSGGLGAAVGDGLDGMRGRVNVSKKAVVVEN